MKIQVRLSEKEFLKFSWFNLLHRRKAWRVPAVFAAVMCGFAAICFVMNRIQSAVLLGAVLLAVGLGVPAAYFLSFFLSLRRQAREQELGDGRYVYTLDLGDSKELIVDNGREHAAYPWLQVFHAYRGSSAVYLYITPQRAFLIPARCAEGGMEKLWAQIRRRLPAEQMSVL